MAAAAQGGRMIITEQMRRRMSPADREALKCPTNDETRVKVEAGQERKLQADIANYLRLNGLWCDQDAMHKRRFGTAGAPDFQFPYRGHFVAWECKTSAGRLTAAQVGAGAQITAQGGHWRLIRSIVDAQEHLRKLDAL